jgi:hypothetical protein
MAGASDFSVVVPALQCRRTGSFVNDGFNNCRLSRMHAVDKTQKHAS